MIIWIDRPLALGIHERQLAEHGGGMGVRDARLLESALGRPKQLYSYGNPPPDLADLAASLAFGIVRNHPFVDGNKRTAHVCYRVFCELNGATLQASDEEKYLHMLSLAHGSLLEADFAMWLRRHLHRHDGTSVQESRASYR